MSWGDIDASCVVKNDLSTRFDLLVEQVVWGRVVPLVGAGVSFNVGLKDRPPDFTNRLVDRLRAKLTEDPSLSLLVPDLAGAANASDLPLNRIAELSTWMVGQGQTCDAIQIAEFAEVVGPTRAHRHLALLAREGFVSEIITTNYDCGIERAYIETFGGLYQVDSRQWRAIADGPGYSDYAAEEPPRAAPLRLYKINGCAARYREAPASGKAARASEILLTERQLHHFFNRGWARDLVRDRLRSRQILFSGFGSDEPQIRHVLMDVLEELHLAAGQPGSGGPSATASPAPPGQRPTPPRLWVSNYEARLPFHIVEALVAEHWARKRSGPTNDAGLWPPSDEPGSRKSFDSVFTGLDAGEFAPTEEKLSADLFWPAVFARALLKRLTRSTSCVHRLRALLPAASQRRSGTLGHCAATWARLVRLAWNEAPSATHIPDWLHCSSGSHVPGPRPMCRKLPDDRFEFLPFAESPDWTISLILLMAALPGDERRELLGQGRLEPVPKQLGEGVRIENGENSWTEVALHVQSFGRSPSIRTVAVESDPEEEAVRKYCSVDLADCFKGAGTDAETGEFSSALVVAVQRALKNPFSQSRESERQLREQEESKS